MSKVLKDNLLLVSLIMKNRKGEIKVKPGYDGVYGEAILDDEKDNDEIKKEQKSLF